MISICIFSRHLLHTHKYSSGSLIRMILHPASLSIFPDNIVCLRFLTMYVLVAIGLNSPVQSLTWCVRPQTDMHSHHHRPPALSCLDGNCMSCNFCQFSGLFKNEEDMMLLLHHHKIALVVLQYQALILV